MTPDAHVAESPVFSSPCTCLKARSLARTVTHIYDECLAPSGLRVTQFSLIGHARTPKGGRPPAVSELAARLFTDRTTLTRNLRPLIAAGYLRLEHGDDARSKSVIVTDEGERAWRNARALWRDAQALVRERAGTDTIAELEGLIERAMRGLIDASRAAP
jgi:DNA-binding MarR family transcriptional regulator